MGERIRAFDWAATPLGPPESWPQSLRSAVSILLPSSAQIVLFWGTELTTIYNDAYSPVLGKKHPRVLGTPARVCWEEIWNDVLGPLFTGVLTTGESFWAHDRLFFLERNGYLEETYFDISYDPVRDESGNVGGIFCIVSETTGRVLGKRRLKILQEIGTGSAAAATAEEVCRNAIAALRETPGDVPWAGAYLLDTQTTARQVAAFGASLPDAFELTDAAAEPLALSRARASAVEMNVREGMAPPSDGRALVLPLVHNAAVTGFLVAGVSRYLALEGPYRDFFDLVAASISTGLARARALEEERRRAEALAEMDRLKTQFFSNVSHEFRTPLTLMLGPVEEARRDAEERGLQDQSVQLEVVERNSRRLLRLVNTLLDFSRLEAGRVEASYEPTDLAAVTSDLASSFRSTMERGGLRLVVVADPLDEPVWVDREMWEKIVLNLLSNAFKFTFEGEVAVRIARAEGRCDADRQRHRRRDPRRRAAAHLRAVSSRRVDAGPHLRGDRNRTVAGPGAGAPARRIGDGRERARARHDDRRDRAARQRPSASGTTARRAHDDVDEHVGGGVRRGGGAVGGPRATRGSPDANRMSAEIPARSTDSKGCVIVADDNADMRDYVGRLLAAEYRVCTASNGEEALALARQDSPDLVVADVMMPRLDGFGLLSQLRSDAMLADVPVILLSARAGESSRVDGLTAGADDYLVKPFSARELLATVNAHVALARMRRRAREEALTANREKDEFLAVLSHELRTPLNAVLGYIQMLRGGMIDDARRDQILATIDRNARLQVRLLEDVLDVSRITTGKLRIARTEVDLQRVLVDALETIRPLAEAQGVEILSDMEPGLPVAGDAPRLQQVVWNLLSNGVKFTPRGGQVRLVLARDGSDALITVTDTGAGIAPEFLPRLFLRFSQADPGTAREHGGLGLGLAITRHLVELHGGTIQASSAGRHLGTTVHVRLPLQAVGSAVEANP